MRQPAARRDDDLLSIIVVSWNTRDLLAECLGSVAAGCGAHAGSVAPPAWVETIVVDNASTDGSAGMVEERFPWARLLTNGDNVGFARANNQALAGAGGRFLLLLNSDTRVAPGALRTLIDFMGSHPLAGAVGPQLLNADGSVQPSCFPMMTPSREFWRLAFLDLLLPRATYGRSFWRRESPAQVGYIMGACLLLRRAALDEVGLLDDSYFMYSEEVDLCYRLEAAGWERWWLPAARVVHYGGGSSRQAAQAMYIELYRSKVQFFRKFGGEPAVRRFNRLVRSAYWPRLAVAAAGAPFSRRLAAQAGTFRRLLAELPSM